VIVDTSTSAASTAPKKIEKIAICGTAESLPMAPYEDKEFEIWSISCALTYPCLQTMGQVI
jgi:hypothetical protein